MKKIGFIIDSSFGIKNLEFDNVFCAPIVINETVRDQTKSYNDAEITYEQMVNKLRTGIEVKTSQTSPKDMINLLDHTTKEYEKVFVIPIPKKISGAYNTWKQIAKDYKNAFVLDQNTVSLPAKWIFERLLVFVKEKNNDVNEQDIINFLQERTKRTIGVVFVPDVSFLVKGGRVSGFKGAIAKMLNIKLAITLYDDGLVFFGKSRSIERCVKLIKKSFEQKTGFEFNKANIDRISYFYSSYDQKFKIDEFEKEINKQIPEMKVCNEKLPLSIIGHTGPNYIVACCEFKDNC